MRDIEDEIKQMGFDAETAHNIAEVVRTTRNAAIEECAKVCDELRRADYSAESPDWTAGTDDCAKAIRALAVTSGIREGKS